MIKDQLFEESRIIRKAVNEGKTTSEIMSMLGLTKQQIRYRLETRYAQKISQATLKKLAQNDMKSQLEKTEETNKEEISQNQETLVLDTSALHAKNAIEIITSYKTVIISLEVIKQMKKYKKERNLFGRNIRKVFKYNSQDQEGKKFLTIEMEQISKDPDDNIINYCKGKDVILYTGDNEMASTAKGYKIKYILADTEEEEISTETSEKEEISTSADEKQLKEINRPQPEAKHQAETQSQLQLEVEPEPKLQYEEIEVNIEELKNSMMGSRKIDLESLKKSTIDNIKLLGKTLTLVLPETTKISYIVLSDDKIKSPIAKNMINLELGDIIIIMTYKNNALNILWFEIIDIKQEEHAIYQKSRKITDVKEIDKCDLPEQAKRKVRNYFTLVRKS